ncbi:MAG: hypothetical protein M0R17_08460 [Candidatus Omnitrophica bacterium]|jgi:hypothetical protein|nr:hypothetical protein [Candidatus Omnitrophota bacterium]
MGYSSYSTSNRKLRSTTDGYTTKGINEIFTQNVERKIHKLMDPSGISKRECCDSDAHPFTIPVQLYLDVTGSMGMIPHELIKEGLPKLIGSLIQNGLKDIALLFGAIGDHECDNYPLQIAQFESGDAELDMWLTRTYLEGGGGGNVGESYLLAWYFASNHIKIDSFDKRKQKGFIFTVGDEPCLNHLPMSAVKEIMGDTAVGQATYSKEELLAAAQIQNNVYHIHINHSGCRYDKCIDSWKQLLGQNLIVIDDYHSLSKVISDIIISHSIVDSDVTNTTSNLNNNPQQTIIL